MSTASFYHEIVVAAYGHDGYFQAPSFTMLIGNAVAFTMLLLCSLTVAENRSGRSSRATLEYFDSKITNYSSFVFDPDDDVVYIAGRNYLVELNISSMLPIGVYESQPTEIAKELCHRNWKPDAECENFMKIDLAILRNEDDPIERTRFLICNSNAHQPFCEIRSEFAGGTKLEVVEDVFTGKPRDVLHNHVLLASVEPDQSSVAMYSAGYVSGDLQSITKSFGEGKVLSTSSSSAWLNKPVFLSMHEHEQYIFVFFREAALEAQSAHDVVYSRVARLCKADRGRLANADLLANELLWSSFAKARLLCAPRAAQVTGTQLQYDFLQDVQFDKKRQQFVAVFLNKDPAVWAWSNHARSLDSAVCTFSVHDLLQAFSGPRLHLDKTGQWTLSNEFPATCPPTGFRHASDVQSAAEDSEDSQFEQLEEEKSLEEEGEEGEEERTNEHESARLLSRRTRESATHEDSNVLQYNVVRGRLSATLPGTFVQQIAVNTAQTTHRLAYLLDSNAVLHTVVDDTAVLRQTLAPELQRHGRLRQSKFNEMKLYSRNHSDDYLVIISDDRVIRVSLSLCERLLDLHDCAAQLSLCYWHYELAMCLPQSPLPFSAVTHSLQSASAPQPVSTVVAPVNLLVHAPSPPRTSYRNAVDAPQQSASSLNTLPFVHVTSVTVTCQQVSDLVTIAYHTPLRCTTPDGRTLCSGNAVWTTSNNQIPPSAAPNLQTPASSTSQTSSEPSKAFGCKQDSLTPKADVAALGTPSSGLQTLLAAALCFLAGLLSGAIAYWAFSRRRNPRRTTRGVSRLANRATFEASLRQAQVNRSSVLRTSALQSHLSAQESDLADPLDGQRPCWL